ncbi:MAG: DUF4232 domain-containing protein [Sulfobacillus sp.]
MGMRPILIGIVGVASMVGLAGASLAYSHPAYFGIISRVSKTASSHENSPASRKIPVKPVQACSTTALTITLFKTGEAGGTDGGYIKFTNHGSSPCALHGWPVIIGVKANGSRSNPAAHVQSTMFGPVGKGTPTVVLRHGQSAAAALVGSDMPGPNGRPASIYRTLLITPPGSAKSVTISARLPADAAYLSASTKLYVSIIVPMTKAHA